MTVDGLFSGPNGELDWMASALPHSADTSAITTLALIRGYLGEPAHGRGAEAASAAAAELATDPMALATRPSAQT
jgi:hypothetical protein